MSDRKSFFFKVQKWIDRFAINEEKIITGGDFNFTEDNSLTGLQITIQKIPVQYLIKILQIQKIYMMSGAN